MTQATSGTKRPVKAYLFQCGWIILTIIFLIGSGSDLTFWIFVLYLAAGFASLVHMFIRRNYFEVKDDKLIIYRSFIIKESIELQKVEKLIIEPGPFTSSKILLKDQSKLPYSDSQVNDKELTAFMAQFNIPVE